MMGRMDTQQHFTAEHVDDWLRSPECRTTFVAWICNDPARTRQASHYMVGYAPPILIEQGRSNTEPFTDWLLALPVDHPATRWLWDCLGDDWIGTEGEHGEHSTFHDLFGPEMCGECYL